MTPVLSVTLEMLIATSARVADILQRCMSDCSDSDVELKVFKYTSGVSLQRAHTPYNATCGNMCVCAHV